MQSDLKPFILKSMTGHNSEVKKYPNQMSLETANEMYIAAFLVKKTRFSVENPSLTDVELNQKTARLLWLQALVKIGAGDISRFELSKA